MHVRMVDTKKGLIAIQAEVEVSRDYLQHLFCQRTPVIYEIEEMLKKHQVDYKIWNKRIKKICSHAIINNYKIKLSTPNIPVFAWKPMLFSLLQLVHFIFGNISTQSINSNLVCAF